uniref:Ectopic P-granules autophagy protein 5 homolog n=1 Tax=Varanus komodoensis TaxID=61221 RepID=A0A8D2L1T6_VARKO
EAVPPQLSLPSTLKDEERFPQSSDTQVEHCPQPRLCSEVVERENMKQVPLEEQALDAEGSSVATQSNPPTQVEESRARTVQEGDLQGKASSPQNVTEADAAKTGTSGLSEKSPSCTPPPTASAQHRETENVWHIKDLLPCSPEEGFATDSVPVEEVREHVENSGVRKLYPDLPSEIFHEQLSGLAIEPRLAKGKLYPEILVEPELLPFSKEQLKVFEPCSWLENVDFYMEEFRTVAHQDRHEFLELLLNYWRCRKQLLLAEAELQTLTSDCQSIKGRLWTFKDEQKSVQGVCADQCKVSGHHRYQTVEMSEGALAELRRAFEVQAGHVHQTLALHLYTALLSRLQVESYLYGLLSSSPLLASVGLRQQEPGVCLTQTENISLDLGPLKECISVLFSFTRRMIEDPQFQGDVLSWLRRLVSVLQRVGCPGDHLFLLNHILRCPAGVSRWAVPFIQIRVLGNPSGVFHFMQSLALLMSPAKNRAEFMCHMKPSERMTSLSGNESGNWTLVDEAGEEDEDPVTSWVLLLEDDLVAFLSQFPFHELFQHILGFDSKGVYAPEKATPQEMMKIFAFADSLVELLAVGLETFNRARYRQFVKRIGRLIRMTLCHVSDHWAQYISRAKDCGYTMHPYSVEKLQIEFDELFLRAVLHVLKAKRLGVWLFMSEMPYGTLSSNMLWKLFFIMHCADDENLERTCAALQPADCKRKLKDPAHLEHFEKYLQAMNGSEEICLLTTFAQMAQTKRRDVDEDFVRIIVLEIYEVSYVSLSTRETFSKVGRELLGAITAVHTSMISVLLDRVRDTIQRVGMVTLYLFKELPMSLWKPSASEVALIRDWLLNYNLTEVENKLACVILEGLNWGHCENGILHLDPAVHAEVALTILEAYQKYLSQKLYSGLISESLRQVSYLASIVRYGKTPETSFNQWAWGLVLRLKLHMNDYGMPKGWPPIPGSSAVPELTESPAFHPLLKAVRSNLPIGCYLALAMTTLGHSVEKFCTEGIPLLALLVQTRHLRTVVHLLDKVLPFFYPCQYYLLKNEQFLSCLHQFLQLDSGVPQGMTQQVTHKVAQHLTGTSFGENLRLLNCMIQSHIFVSSHPSGVGPVAVLEFWVQALTSQPLWHREKAVLCLMDDLCQAAFQFNQEDCVQKLLYQQHKNALGYHCDKGLLSSLVSWIVAGNVTPSFIEGNANPAQVWFAWTVLNMESIFEEDSQLRRAVERELVTNSLTPDQALKKVQAQLKLPIVPSLQRLLIYRWAHQALVTPADHPLLPLIWQKFFLLYLHRPGPQYGLPVDGCIGKRFFQSPAQLSLLSDLKQRLIEVADFHHSASKALRPDSLAAGSESSVGKGPGRSDHLTSPELHKELVRLFNIYVLWLEEESFQKGNTYIPSLPKQYDSHRLARVMQNQQDLWTEFVNVERIQLELQEALDFWLQVRVESHAASSTLSVQTDFTNPLLAKERITSSLKKYEAPQPSLPLQPMKAPVPVVPAASLVNQAEAKELIRASLSILQHHAKSAALRESQHVAFNNEILDTLPKLYTNREEQITLQLECRGSSGKSCQGAALVAVQFEGKHKNDTIDQQLHALKKEVRHLQAEATKPPPLRVVEAAVHTENFITALINSYRLQSVPGIHRVGIKLFFTVVEFVCDETQRHPPTRQFFTSCVEVLGQVFIAGSPSECKPVLQAILKNRRLCTLVAPYFTPAASPAEFVNLYEKVVSFLGADDSSDVIFMLLTKFDLLQWLNSSKPLLSERTRLLESIHLALKACGFQPEKDVLMPFSVFCAHWTCLLCYQFPDHYSSVLRLLVESSLDQLLSPDCWKVSLKALGCTSTADKKDVMETIDWLSDYFLKLRLSSRDVQSFGLFSKWTPYIAEVQCFMEHLVNRLVDAESSGLSQEPVGSRLHSLHLVITKLFKPWIEVFEREDAGKQPCYPWLESDAPVASKMVQLYVYSIGILHESFKDKLLPSHHGALWLYLMYYCQSCTAPKMPEHILYTFHTEFRHLPWKEMHPDRQLMEEFFKVERGSPKSCFLFLGSILCEVNWVSVLSSAWSPTPPPETHDMTVCLLYMVVLLAKEEQLVTKESPLLNLLGQTSSLPWQFISILSYQSIISYFNSHYPPSIILAKEPAADLIVKLLKASAGFGASSDSHMHLDATPKCRAYIRQVIHFLSILEQSGKISVSALEEEMSKLLDDIAIFNPPERDMQSRHLALSSLFAEALTMLNNASVATAESLQVSLRGWIDATVHGLGVMPLLTAACQSLASVRHMAETTEACVTAYFNEDSPLGQDLGWGPIVASLQVPELTAEDFLKECLSLGGYLTLYVYTLQQLNAEQTQANEMRVLLMLSKWLEQVHHSSAKDEAKLFLWWHKVLQLCLLQMVQEDAVLMESVIRILMSLQGRQSLLAEERLTSGILGVLGLGRKSALSNRFRVVARSMSAFLLVQIPMENQVRLRPGMELHLSAKAQQALSTLDSLASNKQYAEYQEQISQASQFIKDSCHCLHDASSLLAILLNTLYPEVHYLDTIR